MNAMFVTKLKLAVLACGLIATGAAVVAQQAARIIEAKARPIEAGVTKSTADDAVVARELRRLDLDLLAEEVEQIRDRVEVTFRAKLRAERRNSVAVSEDQGTQSKEVKEAQNAYESARRSYLAKSRELRNEQRRLDAAKEPRQASRERSGGVLAQSDDRVEDRATRKSDSHPAAAIGSIDLEVVFPRYEKAQQTAKQHQASINAEKERLNKHMEQIKDLSLQKEKVAPGSSDFNSLERQILALRQKHESEREAAEREYTQRQARNTTSLLEEIQETIATVAKAKGLNYVVKVSPEPKSSSAPSAMLSAMNRSVLYSDRRNDLTEEVIRELNQKFKATGEKPSR
jgi:Skp family chaperone for outer membrane proteins